MMMKERRGVSFYVESSFALYQIGKPAADLLVPTAEGADKEILKWAAENKIVEPAVYAKAMQVLGDLHDGRANKRMIDLLGYKNENLAFQLFVRMRAADALGRIPRQGRGSKVLSAMLVEEEANARNEYIRAAGPDRAGKDAHRRAGQGRRQGQLGRPRSRRSSGSRCSATKASLAPSPSSPRTSRPPSPPSARKTQSSRTARSPTRASRSTSRQSTTTSSGIEAAKACKRDISCWAKKLDDPDQGVR